MQTLASASIKGRAHVRIPKETCLPLRSRPVRHFMLERRRVISNEVRFPFVPAPDPVEPTHRLQARKVNYLLLRGRQKASIQPNCGSAEFVLAATSFNTSHDWQQMV